VPIGRVTGDVAPSVVSRKFLLYLQNWKVCFINGFEALT
jgi:hypothetical protein